LPERPFPILNRAGCRLMPIESVLTVGVWSDLDSPQIRAALRRVGSDRLPLRYLDGGGIPEQYKFRGVEGEPVPTNVLVEMAKHPKEPWKVRDRMLTEMGWRRNGALGHCDHAKQRRMRLKSKGEICGKRRPDIAT
jgi:hypothetical protein